MSGVGGMGIGVVGALIVRAGHKQGYRVTFQDKKGLAIRNGGVFAQITSSADQIKVAQPSKMNKDRRIPKLSQLSDHRLMIPYGKADLLLGIDILEASRAIDPREQFRVASPEHTTAVLNMHKQPTVYGLLGKDDFDPEALREEIDQHCDAEKTFAANLGEICERRLGSKQFVNILMLGVAYQLGLIPVSARSIAWAIKDTIRREHRKNLKAFNIGRKLALAPKALPKKPEPLTWQQLVTNKGRILRKTLRAGEKLAERVLKSWSSGDAGDARFAGRGQIRSGPANLRSDAISGHRVCEAIMWRWCGRFIAATVPSGNSRPRMAAIWNLAKVMLIKDEPYVAYLLTRYEKKQRDLAKYQVDVSNGDKLVYRHHTSPEFNIGKFRIRLKIKTSDWQLRIVRHMKWWRKLPGWHKRETAFRDWFIGLLDRVSLDSPAEYEKALRVLQMSRIGQRVSRKCAIPRWMRLGRLRKPSCARQRKRRRSWRREYSVGIS